MPVRLVAFDLDGTLARGPTCVEAIAEVVGRRAECSEFERLSVRDRPGISSAREQMAEWYRGHAHDQLCAGLESLPLAPGAKDAFALLRRHGITTAIVSITWSFAVDWFAANLGADLTAGTVLSADGSIIHFWPEDKGTWLVDTRERLGLPREGVAAVGDSDGDRELLAAAGLRYYVGRSTPPVDGVQHLPDANLADIAAAIVSR